MGDSLFFDVFSEELFESSVEFNWLHREDEVFWSWGDFLDEFLVELVVLPEFLEYFGGKLSDIPRSIPSFYLID